MNVLSVQPNFTNVSQIQCFQSTKGNKLFLLSAYKRDNCDTCVESIYTNLTKMSNVKVIAKIFETRN
jgi:hypothetical protein